MTRAGGGLSPRLEGDVRQQDEEHRACTRLKALFEHANDALSLLTVDGIVIDVNRRWEELTGRPRKELIGLHVRDFIAPGDMVPNGQRHRQEASQEQHRTVPVPIRRVDGSVVLLEFSTTRVDIDGSPALVTVGRDVTSLVQSRAQLEASERRYRSLIETIPEVFWSARASDLTLTFLSPNVETICGYSPDALRSCTYGQPFSRVHPEDAQRVTAALERAIERRDKFDEVFRWQRRDGKWVWLHSRAGLAVNESGEETLEGVLSDVTEKKGLEEKLARAQKIEAIGQLTAGIAHDFNNILSVILGNMACLATALAGEERAIAEDVLDAAQRAAELTSRLLAFAQNRSSELLPTDLGAVVEGVRPMLACAVGRSVSLSVSSPRELGTIRANKGEVEQVLMNLVINARDAMPGGGKLFVACSNVDVCPSQVLQDGHPGPGRYVMLSVRDTGTGMDEATRQRIFEPFFTTKAEKGTGLGLSTSYGVVRHHGGHISVDSAPGAGTVFTIYFPRTDEEPAEVVAPVYAGSPPSMRARRASTPPLQAAPPGAGEHQGPRFHLIPPLS